jgi:hypothetical protein
MNDVEWECPPRKRHLGDQKQCCNDQIEVRGTLEISCVTGLAASEYVFPRYSTK